MKAALLLCLLAVDAVAAPVAITCNGTALDPRNGRQTIAGVMTFGFEFDQQAQTMVLTEGGHGRVDLQRVRITDGLASGTDGEWIYEVNRIDGTATLRSGGPEVARYGLGGYYYKGNCSPKGAAPKF